MHCSLVPSHFSSSISCQLSDLSSVLSSFPHIHGTSSHAVAHHFLSVSALSVSYSHVLSCGCSLSRGESTSWKSGLVTESFTMVWTFCLPYWFQRLIQVICGAVSVFHVSNNNSCNRDLMTCVFVMLTKCRKVEVIKLSPSENLLVMNRRFVSCVNYV